MTPRPYRVHHTTSETGRTYREKIGEVSPTDHEREGTGLRKRRRDEQKEGTRRPMRWSDRAETRWGRTPRALRTARRSSSTSARVRRLASPRAARAAWRRTPAIAARRIARVA